MQVARFLAHFIDLFIKHAERHELLVLPIYYILSHYSPSTRLVRGMCLHQLIIVLNNEENSHSNCIERSQVVYKSASICVAKQQQGLKL